MFNNKRKRIDALIGMLMDASYKYYNFGTSPLTDKEFDELERELKSLDPTNEYFSQVGADPDESFPKYIHKVPMLSLDKEYDYSRIESWVENASVIISPKLDGMGLELIYQNGILVKASTRGRNNIGNEVTPNALVIEDIPVQTGSDLYASVRGEVFITKDHFEKICDELRLVEGDVPVNARNYAAGSVKQKDPTITKQRGLSFIAHNLVLMNSNRNIRTQEQLFEELKESGFRVVDYKVSTIRNLAIDVGIMREAIENGLYEYEADGIVITLNNLDRQEELGCTSHHPRYAKAYKWETETADTELLEIEWNTGMSGNIVPLGHIKPVHLSGATISKLKLHNASFLKDNNITVGSVIKIVRAGEVIPKFLEVVKPSGNKVKFPDRCPSCGETQLRLDTSGLFCVNPKCPSIVLNKIKYFIKVNEIDHLGDRTIDKLFEAKLVQEPADIFRLTESQIVSVNNSSVMAKKILNSIDARRNPDLLIFLTSLGIKNFGRETVRSILEYYENVTLDEIRQLKWLELTSIGDIGTITAQDICAGLKECSTIIDELLNAGYVPTTSEQDNNSNLFLVSKVFVITGTLSESRNNIKKKIEAAGGKVSNTISNKTDYLVAGENTGATKMNAAQKCGTQVITEKELNEMLNQV